ncbi:unnamed protein product, partial [Brenthis ino]
MSLSLLKSEQDVRKWIITLKLSYGEVCEKFGIDINNDRRNAFFWNMMLDKKIIINEELLSWCSYYVYRKKRYIVMNTMDFESLLMQMRSRKAQEIRELYSFLKHISMQYMKYEKYYEEHRNELISMQNNQLTQSVRELKDLMLQVEQERLKAEEERQLAEQRHLKVSAKLDTIRNRIRTEVVDRLRTEIAPLVAPPPINRHKDRCLALICISPARERYIVRRQRESFNKAIQAVLKKNPLAKLVKEWHGLAHSVDVGNCVKSQLRNLKWLARGNILRSERDEESTDANNIYSNDDIVNTIDEILSKNSALQLSDQLNGSLEYSQ